MSVVAAVIRVFWRSLRNGRTFKAQLAAETAEQHRKSTERG